MDHNERIREFAEAVQHILNGLDLIAVEKSSKEVSRLQLASAHLQQAMDFLGEPKSTDI